MTVNWQGRHLNSLDQLALFRHKVEQLLGVEIPFTHFINPRYWLRQPKQMNRQLYKVYRPGLDEIALQVNCWHDLVKAAGVKPILGRSLSLEDNGYSTPLGVYSSKSVNDIVAFSKGLLQQSLQQIEITGFRCGCWLSSDKVLTALMHNHFCYDSSAVPPAIFSRGYSKSAFGLGESIRGCASPRGGYTRFYQLMNQLWGYHETSGPSESRNQLTKLWNPKPAITFNSQPYKITQGKYQLMQLPNNGGLADFVTKKYLIDSFSQLTHQPSSAGLQFLNVACQQETAKQAKISLLPLFEFIASKANRADKVKFLTVSARNDVLCHLICV